MDSIYLVLFGQTAEMDDDKNASFHLAHVTITSLDDGCLFAVGGNNGL